MTTKTKRQVAPGAVRSQLAGIFTFISDVLAFAALMAGIAGLAAALGAFATPARAAELAQDSIWSWPRIVFVATDAIAGLLLATIIVAAIFAGWRRG